MNASSNTPHLWTVGDRAIYVAGPPHWRAYKGKVVEVTHVGVSRHTDAEGKQVPCATIRRLDTGEETAVTADARHTNIRPLPEWMREFGEAWGVPAIIWQDPELFDQSWHNDAMPIFVLQRDADKPREDAVCLSVDHVDPTQGEFGGEPHARFHVWATPAGQPMECEILYEGEDAAAALAALKAAPEKGPEGWQEG